MTSRKGQLSQHTLRSGGARGADVAWERVCRHFGVGRIEHYYIEGSPTFSGDHPIPREKAEEADPHLCEVNKIIGRIYPPKDPYVNDLLRRSYFMALFSEAIYAVSSIDKQRTVVAGGTGWACHLGVIMEKPVCLFDQKKEQWFFLEGHHIFEEIDTPVLKKNFAGIGTRKLNDAGLDAIADIVQFTCDVLHKNAKTQ